MADKALEMVPHTAHCRHALIAPGQVWCRRTEWNASERLRRMRTGRGATEAAVGPVKLIAAVKSQAKGSHIRGVVVPLAVPELERVVVLLAVPELGQVVVLLAVPELRQVVVLLAVPELGQVVVRLAVLARGETSVVVSAITNQ